MESITPPSGFVDKWSNVFWESRFSIWRGSRQPINYKLDHSAEFFLQPSLLWFLNFVLKSLFKSYQFITSSIQLLFYYYLVTLWFTSHQHLQLKDIGTVGDYKTYGQPWKQGQELKQSYISQVLHKLKQILYFFALDRLGHDGRTY